MTNIKSLCLIWESVGGPKEKKAAIAQSLTIFKFLIFLLDNSF